MRTKIVVLVGILFLISVGFLITRRVGQEAESQPEASPTPHIAVNTMKIESPAFKPDQRIPAKYTCDGANVNPPLAITDIPEAAKSLVLIMDDPDAPRGTWVHWTMWNISPDTREIGENSVPAGAVEGVTSFGKPGHGGPCPPSGTHRYFFKLYALDILLDLPATVDKAKLEDAMRGRILAQAELVGLYQRQ